jgi:PhnB protein
VSSTAEDEQKFNSLAENGRIDMPMDKTFFAARFGMLKDRFGIPWMVICEKES